MVDTTSSKLHSILWTDLCNMFLYLVYQITIFVAMLRPASIA